MRARGLCVRRAPHSRPNSAPALPPNLFLDLSLVAGRTGLQCQLALLRGLTLHMSTAPAAFQTPASITPHPTLLPSHCPSYRCSTCTLELALQDELVSRSFQGSSGPAYLWRTVCVLSPFASESQRLRETDASPADGAQHQRRRGAEGEQAAPLGQAPHRACVRLLGIASLRFVSVQPSLLTLASAHTLAQPSPAVAARPKSAGNTCVAPAPLAWTPPTHGVLTAARERTVRLARLNTAVQRGQMHPREGAGDSLFCFPPVARGLTSRRRGTGQDLQGAHGHLFCLPRSNGTDTLRLAGRTTSGQLTTTTMTRACRSRCNVRSSDGE